MNNKKILILGANPESIGLVNKAKEMGYYTIVTDYNPNAPAKRYADQPINIDAVDSEKLISFVRENGVDNILLGVAEALMPAYIDVCNSVGKKPYLSHELAQLFTNKKEFKKVCKDYDVPVVEEYSLDEIDNIKYPVVVKPVDSCSSKGISICYNKGELISAVPVALDFSKSKNIIIERYMTGQEVVLYYVIQDSNPFLVGMCDRYTNKEQDGLIQLPTSYIFPSKHLDKFLAHNNAKVIRMLKGIGVTNGVLFIQSFIENGETRFYEPGFRLNGAQEHFIIKEATGIDGRELMINFAVNEKMSNEDISKLADPYLKGKFGCKLSPLIKPGKISKIIGLDSISNNKNVVSLIPSYSDGDVVGGIGTLKQIACRFFIVTDTIAELKETISFVQHYFDVFDENGRSMKLKGFDVDILDSYC